MVVCLQFMGDYWLRHIRLNFTEDFTKGINKGILELFKTTIGINTANWSTHATERVRLPLRMKGCRLREAENRRHGKFVGAMLQSIPPLIDPTESNNCYIPGRLNIPAIKNLLGEGSFNHPCTAHWEVLLKSNPSGNLSIGLKYVWSHLKTTFQDVITQKKLTDNVLLLPHDVTRASFYHNSTIASLVTNTITLEPEKAQATCLEEWIEMSLPRIS